MESLDAIVSSLEGESLGLEDMVGKFERGMLLLRSCRSRLDAARGRIEAVMADPDGGRAVLTGFAESEEADAAEDPAAARGKRAPRKKNAAPEVPAAEADAGDIRLF